MTDRKEYRNSQMDGQEALEYAREELGDKIRDVPDLENYGIHGEVKGFIKRVAAQGEHFPVEVTEYENGVLIEATLGEEIINPKRFVGNRARFWVKPAEKMNIYFKKGQLYYLIRLRI